DIETAIDGIEVGGRNLIPDSEKEVEIINTTTGEKWASTEKFDLEANQTYTFSAEIFIDSNVANSRTQIHYLPTNIDYFTTYRSATPNVWTKITWQFTTTQEKKGAYIRFDNDGSKTEGLSSVVKFRKVKLEKGTKATDWTPAPEDTDAKIDHIETEFTQTFERFDQTVSSLDGRVTAQTQEIDRITRTIQEVTEDVEGNTTKINQTVSTVDKHTQTIATINKDLDGKVETSAYNTLVSTVDSTIRRIGDAEGNLTQIEANVNGIQQTVSDPVNGLVTQVSTLANGFNVLATDFENMDIGGRNYFSLTQLNNIDPTSWVVSA